MPVEDVLELGADKQIVSALVTHAEVEGAETRDKASRTRRRINFLCGTAP
jgi:hypothetical protein